MRRLAFLTAAAVLAGLLLSFGIALALDKYGGSVTGLRDVAIIILALFYLIPALIAAAASFAGAWAIGRFGEKAVSALVWVGRKVTTVESAASVGVEKAAVRPLARTARTLAAGTTYVRAVLGLAER